MRSKAPRDAGSSTIGRALCGALALAFVGGCGFGGGAFLLDDRVDIVDPHDRSEVRLPVTVDWTVDAFAVGPDRGSFGVFVDRAPQPPGEALVSIFRDHEACRGDNLSTRCNTDQFLGERFVHRTTETAFTVAKVSQLSGGRRMHEVIVVLLDAAGRRVGEGAWSVRFEVEEDT